MHGKQKEERRATKKAHKAAKEKKKEKGLVLQKKEIDAAGNEKRAREAGLKSKQSGKMRCVQKSKIFVEDEQTAKTTSPKHVS